MSERMHERTHASTARLSVEHETLYKYNQAVEQAQHIACLRPLSDAGQTLEVFEMGVSPTPSQHSTRRDSHGNSRAYFALHAAHTSLRVVARSQVQVHARYASLQAGKGPTCREVRARLAYRVQAPFEPASEYLYASPFVPLHEALRAYAEPSLQDDRPLAEAAMDLMRRIHADFDYAPASTDISTPILDVLAQRKGVCQDFAHLMLGCLRACGLAARYVSGYLLTRPPPGQAPLVGADASHAWVSVWIPQLGLARAEDWLDLDPTNDCVPDLHHVRVAHGRDFGDVTPLRGVIRGGGHHTLLVRVTTRLLDEPALHPPQRTNVA
ncbi:MAG: transglutaminase family protein [Aquabacterium sp.]